MNKFNLLFESLMKEMAKPTKDMKGLWYYHGCCSQELGEQIVKEKILKPGNEELFIGEVTTPELNKVYLTDNLKYGIIYTLGANMLGHDMSWGIEKSGQYGYLFKINGKDLKDVQPDEDSIGEIFGDKKTRPKWLYKLWCDEGWDDKMMDNLPEELEKDMEEYSSSLEDMAMDGVCAAQTYIGRILVRLMTDEQKIELMEQFQLHIAHDGKIKISEAWKFDKALNPKLKPDGSNFFELAEKVF